MRLSLLLLAARVFRLEAGLHFLDDTADEHDRLLAVADDIEDRADVFALLREAT